MEITRIEPGPGQESVWDYPRPPRIEPIDMTVRVEFGGRTIATSDRALRVLETSGPPTVYIPREDIEPDSLRPNALGKTTFCEWKGTAGYLDAVTGDKISERAAWTYEAPTAGFESLAGHVSFYPGRVDACFLGDERVTPQAGNYYGGWITSNIVGPFKGEPGTEGW